MKKILFVCSFFALAFASFGQSDVVDSLKTEISNYFNTKSTSLNEDTTAVLNLLRLSEKMQTVGFDSAIYYGTQAADLSKTVNWKSGQISAAYNMGNIHYKISHDFESAILFYREAIKYSVELYPDEQGGTYACRYYYFISNSYSYIGQYEKAKIAALKSIEIAELIEHKTWRMNGFNILGSLARNTYDFDESIEYYETCLSIIEELDNEKYESVLYGNLALSYSGKSDFMRSLEFLDKAIEIDTRLENERGLIRHFTNKGNSYRSQGELDNSIEVLNKALVLAEKIGDTYSSANILSSLAIVFNMKGDYDLAIENNQMALSLYSGFNDVRSVANTLGNMGLDYQYSGNYLLALEYHNKSNAVIEENSLPNSGASLGNIALIYDEIGNHEKALEIQMEVLELTKKNDLPSNKALCLANIGGIYQNMKEYEKALEYYEQAYALSIELNMNSTAANCMSDMGNLNLYEERYLEALDYYEKAIKQYENMDAKYNLAVAYSNKARALSGLERHKEAISAGEIATDNALRSGNRFSTRLASKSLYHAHYKNKTYDDALVNLSLLRRTISNDLELNYLVFSEKERENYFLSMEDDIANYFDFGNAHFKNYPSITDTMYNLALNNKGLSLKSSTFIRQSIIKSGDTTLIQDYDRFIANKKKAAYNFSKGINDKKLAKELIEQERSLVTKSGVFNDFSTLKNMDWRVVRDGLKKNEAAIEFINFKSAIDSLESTIYAAMIVKKNSDHPEIVKLCTEEELKSILEHRRGSDNEVVKEVYGKRTAPNQQLYKKIWQPMNQQLKGIKKVYYSPSGLLHKISFAALSNGEELFLCDEYDLYQQSSTGKVAQRTQKKYESTDQFMLIGGVQYNSSSTEQELWSYLPGTEAEINSIASFLKKKKQTVYRLEGYEAKEKILKERAGEASVLHVSTHGFFFSDPEELALEVSNSEIEYVEQMIFRGSQKFDSLSRSASSYMNWNFVSNRNPLMRSGLVLAGANDIWQRDPNDEGEDGVLTAQEVSNLNLTNTKLVVLSACETGLGDIKGSEGVFGLQRAFKMAGAQYLIMSLWQVPDKETAEFMKHFYKTLTKQKDIKYAFQTAQRIMSKKYDPYFWAAFVLID